MAAWIELHSTLLDHWKVLRLASVAKVDDPDYARAKLENLWLWAIDRRETGNLTGLSASEIAHACRWKGDPNVWLTALVDAGFIDSDKKGGLKIHDWKRYAGPLLHARQYNRLKQKRIRDRQKQERNRLRTHEKQGTFALTVPNRTQPNRTKPGEGERNAADAAQTPPPRVENPPQQDREFGPVEEAERQIRIAINQAKLIGTAAQKQEFAQGWRAAHGGAKTLEILSKPEVQGRDIFEVHRQFFRKNGVQNGSWDRIMEMAREEDRKREAKDAAQS